VLAGCDVLSTSELLLILVSIPPPHLLIDDIMSGLHSVHLLAAHPVDQPIALPCLLVAQTTHQDTQLELIVATCAERRCALALAATAAVTTRCDASARALSNMLLVLLWSWAKGSSDTMTLDSSPMLSPMLLEMSTSVSASSCAAALEQRTATP
jgi:hypothetical protein